MAQALEEQSAQAPWRPTLQRLIEGGAALYAAIYLLSRLDRIGMVKEGCRPVC